MTAVTELKEKIHGPNRALTQMKGKTFNDALDVAIGDKAEDDIYRPGETIDPTQGGKNVKRYLNQTIMKVLPKALEELCVVAVEKGAIVLTQKEDIEKEKKTKRSRGRKGSISGGKKNADAAAAASASMAVAESGRSQQSGMLDVHYFLVFTFFDFSIRFYFTLSISCCECQTF